MALITFNGDATIPQPQGLKEEKIRQLHDRFSITGTQRRIWLSDKYQVTITWTGLTPAQYAQLAAYLYDEAQAVAYANATTGVAFSAFPTTTEDQYIAGATFLKDISAVLLET